MTYILYACLVFNTWLGACGRHLTEEFPSQEQCRQVLTDLMKQPAFSFGYCKQKPAP